MENCKEQDKEMTAQESLDLISVTLNNNRRSILCNSAKYFVLWGTLLTLTSLAIYLLWHLTGKPQWNFLWFAMPLVGYPVAALMGKTKTAVPQNEVSKMPCTTCKITQAGIDAFESYVKALREYIS